MFKNFNIDNILFNENLNTAFLAAGVGISTSTSLNSFENQEIKILFTATYLAAFLASAVTPVFQKSIYDKNLTELSYLYGEFIMEYTKFNDQFGYENPYEIYQLYEYMLKSGYLSYQEKIEFIPPEKEINKTLLGASVVCGRGVCRNLSSMLKDILLSKDIYSLNLPVKIVDEKTQKITMSIFENILRYHGLFDIENDILVPTSKADHAIVSSIYNGNTYFLDPMKESAYFLDGSDFGSTVQINDSEVYKIFECYIMALNNADTISKYLFKRKTLDLNEVRPQVKLCENKININDELCKKFSSDNQELKAEINHGYQRVLRRANKLRINDYK